MLRSFIDEATAGAATGLETPCRPSIGVYMSVCFKHFLRSGACAGTWFHNPHYSTNLLGTQCKNSECLFAFSLKRCLTDSDKCRTLCKCQRLQILVERGRGHVAKLVLDFMRGHEIPITATHCNALIGAIEDLLACEYKLRFICSVFLCLFYWFVCFTLIYVLTITPHSPTVTCC